MQIFEPAEISQRHLTQADEKIRQVDLPERFQLLQRAYLPSIKYDSEHPLLQEDEIPDAAAYIAPRISQQYTDQYLTTGPEGQENELKQPFIDCIHAVLTQMHLDHFCEVSFIAVHRSDLLCMPGSSQAFIDRAGLWRVLHLSFEYRGLLERRKSLTKRFERLNVPDPYYEKYLYPRCATSLEGTSDLAEWLRLTKAARARKIREEDPMVDEKPNAKQAARKTKYDIAKEDSAVSGYAEVCFNLLLCVWNGAKRVFFNRKRPLAHEHSSRRF